MDYKAALAYIEGFIDYERSPDFSRQARLYNLDRISLLLELLGNPHDRLQVVHIAGSKGERLYRRAHSVDPYACRL